MPKVKLMNRKKTVAVKHEGKIYIWKKVEAPTEEELKEKADKLNAKMIHDVPKAVVDKLGHQLDEGTLKILGEDASTEEVEVETYSQSQLEKMRKAEVVKIAKARGLSVVDEDGDPLTKNEVIEAVLVDQGE